MFEVLCSLGFFFVGLNETQTNGEARSTVVERMGREISPWHIYTATGQASRGSSISSAMLET